MFIKVTIQSVFLKLSDIYKHWNKLLPTLQEERFCKLQGLIITFTVTFIPRIHTILESIADQCIVNTHVAVAEECIAFTGG